MAHGGGYKPRLQQLSAREWPAKLDLFDRRRTTPSRQASLRLALVVFSVLFLLLLLLHVYRGATEEVALEGPRRYELGGAGPAGPESATRQARRARGGVMSVANVYRDVNVHRPADYWDYDNLSVRWG